MAISPMPPTQIAINNDCYKMHLVNHRTSTINSVLTVLKLGQTLTHSRPCIDQILIVPSPDEVAMH